MEGCAHIASGADAALTLDVQPDALPRVIFRRPPDLRHDELPENRPVRALPPVPGMKASIPSHGPLRYLVNPKMCKVGMASFMNARTVPIFKVLAVILRDHGYDEETDLGSDGWSLFVVHGFLEKVLDGAPQLDVRALQPHQKINRMPGVAILSDKASLWRCVAEARATLGSKQLDFMPDHYVLPEELDAYVTHMRERLEAQASASGDGSVREDIWILKPGNGSKGSGIFLHRPRPDSGWGGAVAPREVREHRGVTSVYIDPPYLMDGLKSDLRVYVLLTSACPLRCYVYPEGLARFATESYDTDDLDVRCAHLTNYSLNKHSAAFDGHADADAGSKRSLSAFRRRLISDVGEQRAAKVWRDVDELIVNTLLAAAKHMHEASEALCPGISEGASPFFQLVGFDVMLDEQAKPWLLEVNVDPSLDTDSPLDLEVKAPLIVDMLNLVGLSVPPPPTYTGGAAARGRAAAAARRSVGPAGAQGPGRRMSRADLVERQQQAVEEAELTRSRSGEWRRLYPRDPMEA